MNVTLMLASAQVQEKLKEVVSSACNKIKKNGKTYRGLNPWQEEDYQLLMFLAKGENAINGFRNKDLRKWLYPESEKADKAEQKKYSGRTTRLIKLLRAWFNTESSQRKSLCFNGKRAKVLCMHY